MIRARSTIDGLLFNIAPAETPSGNWRVILFGDVAGVFARSFCGMSVDNAPAVLCWDVCDTFCAIAPSLSPFVIAALPPWRRLAMA